MPVHRKMNYFLLLTVIFGGFFIFGFSENVRGPAIPKLQNEFVLDESKLGILLALNSLGYLLACTFTSSLSRRIGVKWTGTLAFFFMGVGGILISVSTGYGVLSASFFLLYVANGMLEIGLAIMAARIFVNHTGTMMNLAHFFYGLSSTVAPIVAARMMGWELGGDELGWRGMYAIMLSLSLLPILPTLLARFPGPMEEHEEDRISYRMLLKDKTAWLIALILSFGVISELSIGSWLVYFLQKAYGWSNDAASGMLSLFFLFFMLARLMLGPVTDRIGYTLSVLIFALLSGVCSLAGIWSGEQGAFLLALAGIGIAPIYPTVMAILAKRYARGSDTAITFTVTFMGICVVLGNLVIGTLIDTVRTLAERQGAVDSQLLGLQAGYAVIALTALLCALFTWWLYRHMKQQGELV